jgi:hypothetical protein
MSELQESIKTARPSPLKGRAVLFGLNYKHLSSNQLEGCINDVNMMADFLKNNCNVQSAVYTDETTPNDTTNAGIIRRIMELAAQSFRDKLDFAYIHYSGHGTYVSDSNKDEVDGQDEALVPSDVNTSGVITDDVLTSVFQHFNPKTKVVCVFDCCHSGSICDLKYSYEASTRKSRTENANSAIKGKVLMLSGCLDNQTSADAYNLQRDEKFSGALTSCLLMAMKENPAVCNDTFELHSVVVKKLKEYRFLQVPLLSSTYSLTRSPGFLPLSTQIYNTE